MSSQQGTSLSPSRRLFLLKIQAYMDYGFSVIGIAFNGMLQATMGLPVDFFFMLSILSVVTAFVAQNTLSRRSDTRGNRIPYIMTARVMQIGSTLMIAFVRQPWIFVVAVIMNGIVSAESTANVIVYELIDEKQEALGQAAASLNKSWEFAKYRLFGSIGWAWTAPFGGMAIKALNGTNGDPYFGYMVMYSISAAGMAVTAAFLYYIIRGSKGRAMIQGSLADAGARVSTSRFYLSTAFLMLVSTSFLYAISHAIQSNPFAKYLKDGLGAGEDYYGLLMFLWATAEVPLFFLSSYLVKKRGWKLLILLSLIFNELKLIAFSFSTTPAMLWLVAAVHVLNPFGISFPAKTYAITNEIARDRKALGMTLHDSFSSLGSFIGSLAGMLIAASLGTTANTMAGYQYFFAISIIITACNIAVFAGFEAVDRAKRKGRLSSG
ncbi:MAG: MFS transporter [Candidatus Sigynarchaeum springense]